MVRKPHRRRILQPIWGICAVACLAIPRHEWPNFALPAPEKQESPAKHAASRGLRNGLMASPVQLQALRKANVKSQSADGYRMIGSSAIAMAAAAAAAPTPGSSKDKSLWQKSAIFVYIILWYFFAIAYNVDFKKALISFPHPWTHALWQISFGWFIFGPLWAIGIRKVPKLTRNEVIKLVPSALGNLVLHVGAIIAFFGGAVSFVHIVKASEPVVSSVLNYFCVGEVLPWQVYASLLPIIGGVSLASAKELSFTWLGFGAAMASNLGAAGRAVYSKKLMGQSIGQNMDSANTFSILTILGTLLLIPVFLIVEKPVAAYQAFNVAYANEGTSFLLHMFSSAFCYYMYNELAFLALGKLDPVSHAVVNTMRRVVIIVAAIIVFNTKITLLGGIGSGIAIAGTLLYSLAKSKFKK